MKCHQSIWVFQSPIHCRLHKMIFFRVLLDRARSTRLAPGPGRRPPSFILPLEGEDAMLINGSKRMSPHQTSLSPRKSHSCGQRGRSSTGTNAREAQGESDTALESGEGAGTGFINGEGQGRTVTGHQVFQGSAKQEGITLLPEYEDPFFQLQQSNHKPYTHIILRQMT